MMPPKVDRACVLWPVESIQLELEKQDGIAIELDSQNRFFLTELLNRTIAFNKKASFSSTSIFFIYWVVCALTFPIQKAGFSAFRARRLVENMSLTSTITHQALDLTSAE